MTHSTRRVNAKPLSKAQSKALAKEVKALSTLSTRELLDRAQPLSGDDRARWQRARGRPRKPATEKAVRVLFTIEPALLAAVDRFARTHQLTRAQLIAQSLRKAMSA